MGRLDHLVDAVYERFKDRYFPEERMYFVQRQFTVDQYRDILDEHLKNLAEFDEATKEQGLLSKMLSHIHDEGR